MWWGSRLFIFLSIPTALFLWVLVHQAASSCFIVPDTNPSVAESSLANSLAAETNQIKEWNPIVSFGDSWFKYYVSIYNAEIVAFEIKNPEEYEQATTTMSVVTSFGSTTIPYDKEVNLVTSLRIDQLPNIILSANFNAQLDHAFVVPPNALLTYKRSGPVCVNIYLDPKSRIPIYFVCLLFVAGLSILLRDTLSIITNGMRG